MEDLNSLKYVLEKGHYICKLDLNDSFGKGIYTDLLFWPGLVPRIFTKIITVRLANLRRSSTRILIYLENMSLIGRNIKEAIIVRESIIFLLQYFGFLLNRKKSVMEPTQKAELLGLTINSLDMTLWLTAEKLGKVQKQCLSFWLYYHPLHRHLDISQAITAESLFLYIVTSQTRSGNFGFQAQVTNY